jgi:branched-chain amino acid transport system ATP-binding protein
MLAISGVSLSVKSSQIVALLGTNGAGKTTTLRCVMGKSLLKPLEGEVTKGGISFAGQQLTTAETPKVVAMGISLVPEGRGIFEDMTVEENLKVGAHRLQKGGDLAAEFEKVYSYFPALKGRKKQIAGYLSGGEQQMLAIGRALMTVPKLLMLDEPSLGLAPILVETIFDIISEIEKREGVSILLVEQNASVALEISDYAYIMENGGVVLDGDPETLKEDSRVKEFYLGISSEGQRKHYRNVKSYKKRKRWFS